MEKGQRLCARPDHLRPGDVYWGLKDIGWSITSFVLPDKDLQRRLTQAVCDTVSSVCGLRFYEQKNPEESNILIQAKRGRRNQLDGRGGVLAYAYFPMSADFKGQITAVFDLDEAWEQSVEYFKVWLHEIGHNLGLGHDELKRNQVMNPTYNPALETYQFNDIARLQRMYGPPAKVLTTQPPDTDDNGNIPDKPERPNDRFIQSVVLSLKINGVSYLTLDLLKILGRDDLVAKLKQLPFDTEDEQLQAITQLFG